MTSRHLVNPGWLRNYKFSAGTVANVKSGIQRVENSFDRAWAAHAFARAKD